MSGRIHVREPGRPRGRTGPRRASAGLTPARAIAALAVLATAGIIWGVAASSAFALRGIQIVGVNLTASSAVESALGIAVGDHGPNSFTVRTDEARARLLALPTVADADLRVLLPGGLRVTVTERVPILVWRSGAALLLVDRDGNVVADAGAPDATAAARSLAATLPLVDDLRVSRWALADDWRPEVRQAPRVGSRLQPLELSLASQLLSLVPADVGSIAPALDVAVDDVDGWTIRPRVADPWTAVFGFYSTTIRPPDIVADQVRLLRSLIEGHESKYARAVLASDKAGMFLERSPAPSGRPSPRSTSKP